MDNSNQDKLFNLQAKLSQLKAKQDLMQNEIRDLRLELAFLMDKEPESIFKPETKKPEIVEVKPIVSLENQNILESSAEQLVTEQVVTRTASQQTIPKKPKSTSEIERFIGENLISKIGILIVIIGVAFGAKYSIDHNLLSPAFRIVLGFVLASSLLFFSYRLKAKYFQFSAVLVSGAIASYYIVTFLGYTQFKMYPRMLTFGLMVIYTVFAVYQSIRYNLQLIAHFGLLAAYIVPFLLSNNSGNLFMLLTYISVINIGILTVSVIKNWKSLYFSSFGITWFIYFTAVILFSSSSVGFGTTFMFCLVNFFLFYFALLLFPIVQKQRIEPGSLAPLLLTYGFTIIAGLTAIASYFTEEIYMTSFVLGLAVFQLIIAFYLKSKELLGEKAFYSMISVVIILSILAIPIQFRAFNISIFWLIEGVVLLWFSRKKGIQLFEPFALGLITLGFLALFVNYFNQIGYNYSISKNEGLKDVLFTKSFIYIFSSAVLFSVILYIHRTTKELSPYFKKEIFELIGILLGAFSLITIYTSFAMEIVTYWDYQYFSSTVETALDGDKLSIPRANHNLIIFKNCWIILFNLLFTSVLAFLNWTYLKDRLLGYVTVLLQLLAIAVFLTGGLSMFSELRDAYLNQGNHNAFEVNSFYILFRYVGIGTLAICIYSLYNLLKQAFIQSGFIPVFKVMLSVIVLWLLSNELITLLKIAGSDNAYKYALTILWGIYAMVLIAIGIWRGIQLQRILAIIVLAVTILKLFFYDLRNANTGIKTVLFVILGILLLLVSFLYVKFKDRLLGQEEKE